jgi:betaine-aldehyde dehydrogenase
MQTYRNFINGQYVDAADGRTIPVIDPSTGEQYATAPLSSDVDVDSAMKAAAAAF